MLSSDCQDQYVPANVFRLWDGGELLDIEQMTMMYRTNSVRHRTMDS